MRKKIIFNFKIGREKQEKEWKEYNTAKNRMKKLVA